MIEWIKFKGSTEKERWDEIKNHLPVALHSKLNGTWTIDNVLSVSRCINYDAWAPLNLPEEEKWERMYTYNTLLPNNPDAVPSGMSLKEYAAIHLKVPLSGTPWLDEMIQKARRDEFAKAFITESAYRDATDYLRLADEIIKAADEGKGEG
mgnify:CR=1 FL=1